LSWQAQKHIGSEDRFLVTLRLFNEGGQIVQERVSPPCDGYCPVDNWVPGEAVADRHGLLVPSNLPDGTYSLRLSVYQPRKKQALSVHDGQAAAASELELAQVSIERSQTIVR
jgi:hypothetical protein